MFGGLRCRGGTRIYPPRIADTTYARLSAPNVKTTLPVRMQITHIFGRKIYSPTPPRPMRPGTPVEIRDICTVDREGSECV